MKKVAINGLGRIGRMVFRIVVESDELELVAVNASYDAKTLAHLINYDTTHGKFGKIVEPAGDKLIVDGREILITSERNPEQLPWDELGVDLVLEATGAFNEGAKAKAHIKAGAKKVILTAPGKGDDVQTIVLGVNDDKLDLDMYDVVSNASCTTNCLAPVAKVLNDAFGIKNGLMTTVHAYTNDQNNIDNPHKDLRRARSSAENIIPTSTGAAKAVGKVIPTLNGKLTGMSFRVPTLDVSVVDLTCNLEKPASYEEICAAVKKASENELKGILEYTDEPVVSSDFLGDPHTSIFDAAAGIQLTDTFVKLVAWYDNEWGYSHKLVDLACYMSTKDNM